MARHIRTEKLRDRTLMAPGPHRLVPLVEEDDGPFWEGCRQGRLLVQACAACGHRRFPPRPMCPRCRSTEVRWDEMTGRATIWSFVVVHPPVLPAYEGDAPYNVIVVALDEDPTLRLVGNLVTAADRPPNETDPAAITIGAPVQVVFPPPLAGTTGGVVPAGTATRADEPGSDGSSGIVLPRWTPAPP